MQAQHANRGAKPIVQTRFTADPAPLVHDGIVYLYTGHDEEDAYGFRMLNWLCYSTTDMVNWTDHGAFASLKTFPWAEQNNGAWASQVIARNGKFYFYAAVFMKERPQNAIAVAVADKPTGPFTDALGHPLVRGDGYIDPTVFIYDDGQAYLYWGNPNLWYAKLNKDMISLSGEVVKDASFAKAPGKLDPFHYQEGPWAYERKGHYYMVYASTCCPEGIAYAMGHSPTGPWKFKGYIMKPDRRSSGNHPGIIDYKGRSYVFGFDYELNFARTKKPRERRSVCVAEIHYKPDGAIREIPWWNEAKAVKQIGTLNPYARTEAATICWSRGIQSEPSSQGGMCVYPTRVNAFIKVQGVNFSKGAKTFTASVASAAKDGKIELRLDSPTGTVIGACIAPDTGGATKWTTASCRVEHAAGVHDLYFVFTGAESLKFDWWIFK
ncbi:MAG: family 43 glycosylhydrolase [Phycisphaerales bacterium]|nr:family 43 glycosylhydrolase [Phycisphaerales bacterium]